MSIEVHGGYKSAFAWRARTAPVVLLLGAFALAGHMAWEGMVDEAIAICDGIQDRYHPSKHNPYNGLVSSRLLSFG